MVTSILWKKFTRELVENKGTFLSIASILALGIGIFLTLGITYHSLEYSRDYYYLQGNMAGFLIHVKKAPLSTLPLLQKIQGVRQLESRLQFDIIVDLPHVQQPLGGRIYSLPRGGSSLINRVFLLAGSFFSRDWEHEILVNWRFAKAHGLKVGDTLSLILQKQKKKFRIQGFVITPEYIYIQAPGSIMPDFRRYGIFFMDRRALERYFHFQGSYNQLLGIYDQANPSLTQTVLTRIKTLLEPYGVILSSQRKDFPSHGMIQNELNSLKVMATVLPFIFLLISAMILHIMLSRRIEKSRIEIGTLRALGFTIQEIKNYYFLFGLIIGLLGLLGGILLGILLAKGLLSIYKDYFTFPQFFFRVSILHILFTFLFGVSFSILGVWRATQRIALLQPAESMRPPKPKTGKPIFLEKFLPFWRVLPLTTRFTLRNLFRSWKRSLMTILAIGGAASLLITSFCMHDSAYFFVDHQYHKVIHGDATLKFRNFLGFQGQIDLSKIPGIFYYETYFPLTVTFRNGNLQKKGVILGLPPDPKLRTPRKKDGSLIFIPSEGLVLTQKMAENLHVQKGDILFFQPIEGKRKWFSVPVKEIVQEYVGLSVYASSRYLARLMGESFTFSQSAVKVIPKKESLFFRKLKKLPSLAGYSNIKEERHLLEGLLVENMLVMIFTALFFGGIMYLGAIYNHTLVSLGERSKEIALLRVLGFTSKEVSLQLFQENMILLGLGTILGFPLGYLLSKIVVLELNTDLYRFPLVIYQESYLWTLLLGILFGVFAHWIVVQKVKSFPWLEEINLRE